MLLYVQKKKKKSKALCSPERQAGGRAGQLGLCLGTLVQHESTVFFTCCCPLAVAIGAVGTERERRVGLAMGAG